MFNKFIDIESSSKTLNCPLRIIPRKRFNTFRQQHVPSKLAEPFDRFSFILWFCNNLELAVQLLATPHLHTYQPPY